MGLSLSYFKFAGCKVSQMLRSLCDSNLQYVSPIDLVKPHNRRNLVYFWFQTFKLCAGCDSAKSTCSKRDFWSVKNVWPKSVGKYVKKKWKNLNLISSWKRNLPQLWLSTEAEYCVSAYAARTVLQSKTSREFSFLRERYCLSLYNIFNHYWSTALD